MVRARVCCVTILFSIASAASADTFGVAENQFVIDFVAISGSSNPSSGSGIVAYDYRIAKCEVTNDQWSRFKTSLGVPITGYPLDAYDRDALWTGINMPANRISWYEAAQFINWLNTSTGHQAAYKFTGTQGTANYTLAVWSAAEAAGGTNLYRHKDAFYYLPTEDEWFKAAYWNGTTLQTWATTDNSQPIAGADSNYGQVQPVSGPWDVGSGAQELNGTFDMMGNIGEWMETPEDGDYQTDTSRLLRGGSFGSSSYALQSYGLYGFAYPDNQSNTYGFRVAANTPEPGALVLFSLGGLALIRRKPRRLLSGLWRGTSWEWLRQFLFRCYRPA